ncbi:MAG TPA: acyl-CoA reductase [Thermoanaerobaculia bacterium]|nr:acyl-CoA reductase [Thermoanaerobaculia bacterium]
MLRDAFLPPPLAHPFEPLFRPVERPAGVRHASARWNPEALGILVASLRQGAKELRSIPADELLAAWGETVARFLRPGSLERRALDSALARLCRLSRPGLDAALEAVLGGVRREPAAALFGEARPVEGASPVLVVLASNLPALAVQPLLPALALRRPVLLKSPSAEPLFAPAFLAALAKREPRLAGAVAAVTWPGGERELEAPVLAGMDTVIAYGEQEALDDLGRRASGKVVGYGPKTSLAILGSDADPREAAEGIARDIALFDQRGCLSIAAVFTAGNEAALAGRLGQALLDLARRWPPGPATRAESAAVQHLRLEAEMRGLRVEPLSPQSGTVIVDSEPSFRPSPGLRTVRVHPLPDLGRLPEILKPWRGRLQGAALAGRDAWALELRLRDLGVSRCVSPGELQSPDALWHNGGIHPLEALGR